MTLTNHMLAGSLIAKGFILPVAIPLAFLSHFVLDSLPHFGFKTWEEREKHRSLMLAVVLADVFIATILVAWLIYFKHLSWLLAGFIAFSPDLIWVYRYVAEEKFGKIKPKPGGRFIKFHSGLQKYEFQNGWLLELGIAAGLFALIR